MPSLVDAVERKHAQRAAVMQAEGETYANPLGGMCSYCALACPAREPALKQGTIFTPIQTPDDARRAAGKLAAIRGAHSTLETQLRNYLAKAGPVPLGNGETARLETSFSPVLQLRTVLAALGVEVPEESPEFAVPLDSLTVNSTEFKRFAAAKKRAGLRELVEAAVPTKPRTELRLDEMAA